MDILPRRVSHEKILRGKIFNVAVPHISKRPLDFVVEDSANPGLYKIISKIDGFEGEIDPKTGKKYAPTLRVVTEFKLRPAIIIQNNELNFKISYYYTVALPIGSIYENDKTEPTMQRAMTTNDVNELHYIGTIPGKESYVTIDNPKVVHKNMLFEPAHELIVPDQMMVEIMKKFALCFEIKRIKECDERKNNCDKCEYKLAVNK